MDGEHLGPELIDFLKDELSPEARRQVEAHLETCADCREELQGLEQTLAALRSELVPIELSAHFRMALADRLDEATQIAPNGSAHPTMRASERHIREMKKPVITRLWEHARRSPYFAVSLMAHAAALLIIFGILVKMQTATVTIQNPDSTLKAWTLHPQAVEEVPVVLARRNAPQIETRAIVVDGGVEVDLTRFMLAQFMDPTEETLVLVSDDKLNCVRGYLAGNQKGKTKEELLARHQGGIVETVKDYKVRVPKSLTQHFESSMELYVFRLVDRYEFWSRPVWKRLDKRYEDITACRSLPRVELLAAILRRRRIT